MEVLLDRQAGSVLLHWDETPGRVDVPNTNIALFVKGATRPVISGEVLDNDGNPNGRYAVVSTTVTETNPGPAQKKAVGIVWTVSGLTVTGVRGVELLPDADVISQIKEEAGRRIFALSPLVASVTKQTNLLMEVSYLQGQAEKRRRLAENAGTHVAGVDYLTAGERATLDAGEALRDAIVSIRTKSTTLEAAYLAMSAADKAAFDPTENANWS